MGGSESPSGCTHSFAGDALGCIASNRREVNELALKSKLRSARRLIPLASALLLAALVAIPASNVALAQTPPDELTLVNADRDFVERKGGGEIAWLLGTAIATGWRWRNAGIRPSTDYLLAIQDLAESRGLGHLLPPIRVIKVPVRGPAEGVRAE